MTTTTSRTKRCRDKIREDAHRREEFLQRDRERKRTAYQAKKQSEPRQPWYYRLKELSGVYKELKWNRTCPQCNVVLLEGEDRRFCCSLGRKRLQPLAPLPPEMLELLNLNRALLATKSRELNNLFRFAITGVAAPGKFVTLQGPSTVVIQGRTYHIILPAQRQGHALNWLLYDQAEQDVTAHSRSLPNAFIVAIRNMLERVNPFTQMFRYWHTHHPDQATLQISSNPTSGEIAAVWYGANGYNAIRNIYVHRADQIEPEFLHNSSSAVEPMAYPLLFPHGDMGWFPKRKFLSGGKYVRYRLSNSYSSTSIGRVKLIITKHGFSPNHPSNCVHG